MASPSQCHQGPLLSLRMKTSSRTTSPSKDERQEDVMERLCVMMSQEDSTYKCGDYLLRRRLERVNVEETSASSSSSEQGDPPQLVLDEVDTLCREKMCEWSYRVVDHFHASRELVAVSFSCLDRFIDRCACDRTAFKLAAMTTLHLATKIYSAREISMASLAELSRGEFEQAHIAEMEGIILQTLGWRMHPPTPQCFINHLHGFLSISSTTSSAPAVSRAIYQRACFFAELSLFDYEFVPQSRSAIALASLLNAMEGIVDDKTVAQEEQANFLKAIRETVGMDYPQAKLDSLRNRLWYLYSQSAQYRDDGVVQTLVSDKLSENLVASEEKDGTGGDVSPVSVVRN